MLGLLMRLKSTSHYDYSYRLRESNCIIKIAQTIVKIMLFKYILRNNN